MFGTAPPLYEVHCVKRYLLRANAVCWTKSGSASRLSGRRLAAPPCIRSALTGNLTTIPRAWAMRGRESGTHLCNGTLALGDTGPRSSRFVASSRWPPQRTRSDLQYGALRHNPDRHIAPQRDDQLARHRNQQDPAHPALAGANPLVEPARQGALRLVAQPQPGQLDGSPPRPRVARLGDALVAPDCAALPRTGGQAKVAAHLAPVAEGAEEHFIAQHRGEREPDPTQLRQPGCGTVLRLRNSLLLGLPLGDHLHHQPGPSALAQ